MGSEDYVIKNVSHLIDLDIMGLSYVDSLNKGLRQAVL